MFEGLNVTGDYLQVLAASALAGILMFMFTGLRPGAATLVFVAAALVAGLLANLAIPEFGYRWMGLAAATYFVISTIYNFGFAGAELEHMHLGLEFVMAVAAFLGGTATVYVVSIVRE